MITDKDVKKILTAFLQIFATKDDLNRFATKDDLKEFMSREEMLDHLTDFRSDILDHVDAVYKELLKIREEEAGHFQSHEDINKRLNKLDSQQAASIH